MVGSLGAGSVISSGANSEGNASFCVCLCEEISAVVCNGEMCLGVHVHDAHAGMYVYVYLSITICLSICLSVQLYLSIHCMCVFVCVYVHVYVCIYMYLFIYISMCILMHWD